MVTGVHISGKNNEQSLLFVAIKQIAANKPSDSFIIFTDKNVKNLSSNCTQIIISPVPKNRLLLYYWYSYKLPKLLLKYEVTVFVTEAGMLAASANIKQYLFFSNTFFENDKNVFFKRKTFAALKSSEKIFVADEYIVDLLVEKYAVDADKIQSLYFDLPAKKLNLSWDEIEKNKETYAEGFDYFLFNVSKDSCKQIITVLKSFSQFKKWQKSSMKMVLLLNNINEENLIADFKNYKYRNEVKIITQTEQNILPIIASAFTTVFFGSYVDVPFVFTALQNNIAVIAGDTKTNHLLFKNTVMYSDVSENELAQKMQLLYKDELQKNALIQQSASLPEKFNTVNASLKLFQLITC